MYDFISYENRDSTATNYHAIQRSHTHTSRYLDGLVGAYPAKKDLYIQRSPVEHASKFSAPLLLLQGDEDKIVPPNQSELIFDAVKAQGIACAYLLFEGEQHGFRQSKNIQRALEAELYFYGKVLGFECADEIEPVEIINLKWFFLEQVREECP